MKNELLLIDTILERAGKEDWYVLFKSDQQEYQKYQKQNKTENDVLVVFRQNKAKEFPVRAEELNQEETMIYNSLKAQEIKKWVKELQITVECKEYAEIEEDTLTYKKIISKYQFRYTQQNKAFAIASSTAKMLRRKIHNNIIYPATESNRNYHPAIRSVDINEATRFIAHVNQLVLNALRNAETTTPVISQIEQLTTIETVEERIRSVISELEQ